MTYSDYLKEQCAGLSPYAAGREREKLLALGLRLLGQQFSIKFKEPLQIDANGEFSLVCETDIVGMLPFYGVAFVALLNKHNPRTGILPTKHMDPANNWCRINHFDVERMLNEDLKDLEQHNEGQPC